VEAYGGRQPLKAVGTIMVAMLKPLTVEPWTRVCSKPRRREFGILPGINPVNDDG